VPYTIYPNPNVCLPKLTFPTLYNPYVLKNKDLMTVKKLMLKNKSISLVLENNFMIISFFIIIMVRGAEKHSVNARFSSLASDPLGNMSTFSWNKQTICYTKTWKISQAYGFYSPRCSIAPLASTPNQQYWIWLVVLNMII
jgi:hypothetical protein